MKLLAGIIDGFAVLSVQHIICQPQFIQILLGPLRRICFKKRIQLCGVNTQGFHQRFIPAHGCQVILHRFPVQTVAVAERVRHQHGLGLYRTVGIRIFYLVGAEFSRGYQKCQQPAQEYGSKYNCIRMRCLHLCIIPLWGTGILFLVKWHGSYLSL